MKMIDFYLSEYMYNELRGDLVELLRLNDHEALADQVDGLSEDAIANYYEYMLAHMVKSIVKEGA